MSRQRQRSWLRRATQACARGWRRLREVASRHPWPTAAVLLLLIAAWFGAPVSSVYAAEQSAILEAIRMVESGGRDDCGDGDGGRAIGPFQIHAIYWRDAVEYAPELGPSAGHDYQDCRDRQYARRVVVAYMQRWARDAWDRGDAETIARVHNGGPRGADKRATDRYWAKVAAALGR